jgi:hypothetical protein
MSFTNFSTPINDLWKFWEYFATMLGIHCNFLKFHVATLALGSQPRQGLARLRAKREAWESHHLFSGVQRVWGHEPSHSQVNSHCGSWNPIWTPKFSERNCSGQNPLVWRVFYIIGKLLKRRCLKWAPMTYLDIWSTSYDQKKGRESN